MPSPETSGLYQKAVLWAITGYDKGAQPTYGSPTEIDVEWNSIDKLYRGTKNESVQLIAEVRTNEDIAVGSVLWQGELADWVDSGGAGNSELLEVVLQQKVWDAKGREMLRSYSLALKSGSFTG